MGAYVRRRRRIWDDVGFHSPDGSSHRSRYRDSLPMEAYRPTMYADLRRWKLPSSRWKLPSLQIPRLSLNGSLPSDNVRGSEMMEASILPTEAPIAPDTETLSQWKLTVRQRTRIWDDGSFHSPDGSSHRSRYRDALPMEAYRPTTYADLGARSRGRGLINRLAADGRPRSRRRPDGEVVGRHRRGPVESIDGAAHRDPRGVDL